MDIKYMQRALVLAENAVGYTSPNPLVGAVIVKDGKIIGEGWHKKAGQPHAEINALAAAGLSARGATMYVTLEPCVHHGRTGPCTEAIIQAGIKKVVVAMTDPNSLVAGKGIARLQQAGIMVVQGVLSGQAMKLNEVFIKWITTGMPFGVWKTAISLDGKIATSSGKSQWITSEQARRYGHKLRHRYDAILVGSGTVKADNPALTCRLESGINPVRVVVDSRAETPLSAQLVADNCASTIIAISAAAPRERVRELAAAKNVREVLVVENTSVGLRMDQLFKLLAERNITSVLVEGGAKITASVLRQNLIDKFYCFIAPKLIGGAGALGAIDDIGVDSPADAIDLAQVEIERIGPDILLSGYINKKGD